MDNSAITALAALFGSLIGGMTTLATAWLSQRYGTRSQRLRDEIAKREALYGEYIDEASARMIDALSNEINDANQIVRMYGLFCRIQLVCSGPVLEQAERVLRLTAEVYATPASHCRTWCAPRGNRHRKAIRSWRSAAPAARNWRRFSGDCRWPALSTAG